MAGKAPPMTVTALIVAAGSGSRMGGELPKQYRPIAGKAVLAHAVDALASHPRDRRGAGGDRRRPGRHGAEPRWAAATSAHLIIGGAERADSVRAGLDAIGDGDVVLVHDAARPFCPPTVIDRLLDALESADGAVPVLPVADTLARADGAARRPDRPRRMLVRVQTPQAFRLRGTALMPMRNGAARSADRRIDGRAARPGSRSRRSRATPCSRS